TLEKEADRAFDGHQEDNQAIEKCKRALKIYDHIERSFNASHRDFKTFMDVEFKNPNVKEDAIRSYQLHKPGTQPTGLAGSRSRVRFILGKIIGHQAAEGNKAHNEIVSVTLSKECDDHYEASLDLAKQEGDYDLSDSEKHKLMDTACNLSATAWSVLDKKD